jgi:hypothetical protein
MSRARQHEHDGAQVFDLSQARAARDAAFDQLDRNHWRALARAAARFHLPYGVEMIGEDVARILSEHGLPPPHHHNCWGGLISGLVMRGLLSKTGKQRQMRKVKSHARQSPVYVRRSEVW